jgi:hypothetical protein
VAAKRQWLTWPVADLAARDGADRTGVLEAVIIIPMQLQA